MARDRNEGEGNMTAARHYNEAATATAKNKDKVQRAANEAKKAVDGPDGARLRDAETKGKRKARH